MIIPNNLIFLIFLSSRATGAAGVIIMNNDGDAFFMATTGDEGNGITIPAVMVSQEDGETIKAGAQQGTKASIAPKVPIVMLNISHALVNGTHTTVNTLFVGNRPSADTHPSRN